MHGDDSDDSPGSPPATSSCSPQSPSSGAGSNRHAGDAPARYPTKQFSFVQIMGPQGADVHKVRKVVRVNAAKASAEARKRTIAQRQQRHYHHPPPPPPRTHDLVGPARNQTASLVPTAQSRPDDSPTHLASRTMTMRHDSVVPSATPCQSTSGRFVPLPSGGHGASDWKVNIANLVNRSTPSPTPEDSRNVVPAPDQISVDRTSP